MDRGEVFFKDIDAELLSFARCKVCGRKGEVIAAQGPDVRKSGDDSVDVRYMIACACRSPGFFHVRMSMNDFGYLLARSAILCPPRGPRNLKPVRPKCPELLPALMSEQPNGSRERSGKLPFEFRTTEWADLPRRSAEVQVCGETRE